MPATPIKSPRVLRLPAVIERTGLSRSAIYRGVNEGSFPEPINISERAVGWLTDEVDAFIDRRVALRVSRTAVEASKSIEARK